MTIKFINEVELAEFILEGRLDSVTAADAEKHLMDTVQKHNFKTVVINFGELQYVSSAGLRIFMKLYMYLKKNGSELCAKDIPQNIMDVFEMTGFISLFKFV